jgi:hypothetical protein
MTSDNRSSGVQDFRISGVQEFRSSGASHGQAREDLRRNSPLGGPSCFREVAESGKGALHLWDGDSGKTENRKQESE